MLGAGAVAAASASGCRRIDAMLCQAGTSDEKKEAKLVASVPAGLEPAADGSTVDGSA